MKKNDFIINEGILEKYNGIDENVVIPDGVVEISKESFKGTNISKIHIPDSVVKIGEYAFYKCENLVNVIIPNNVKEIKKGAFADCRSLTEIHIPDNLIEIEDFIFQGCEKLTNITIPDGVTKIGVAAFRLCGISKIHIPDSVTKIEDIAFSYCENLSSITIPESVKKIGTRAFNLCTNLTEVDIPDSVNEIGEGAFQHCKIDELNHRLFKIKNGDALSADEKRFLYQANDFKVSITLPSSVTELQVSAFDENYDPGETIIRLDTNAISAKKNTITEKFIDLDKLWNALRDATHNSSVVKIKNDCIVSEDEKELLLFVGGEIDTITIPGSITKIGDRAFSGCDNLTEVFIPNSISEIGRNAFGHAKITRYD